MAKSARNNEPAAAETAAMSGENGEGPAGKAFGNENGGHKPAPATEAVYTAGELAGAARRVFGDRVTPDMVATALQLEKLDSATLPKARELVGKLMKKEVK